MEKFRITLDKVQQAVKPTGKAVGTISNRLNKQFEVSVAEFATYMGKPNSFSFCPAIYNGERNNTNWLQQQMFCLDFDGGSTPEEVIAFSKEYGLIPNVVYSSFSDTPELRKFRLCYVLDTAVSDAKTAKKIQLGLMDIFDSNGFQTDKACKDYARLFFGGKEIIELNEEINVFSMFIDSFNSFVIVADGGQTRKMVKVAEKRVVPIRYIGDTQKSAKTDEVWEEEQRRIEAVAKYVVVESFNWELAMEKSYDLAMFLQGFRVQYMQLWGLATNLKWVKGGLKLMKTTMEEFNRNNTEHLYRPQDFAVLISVKNNDTASRQAVKYYTSRKDLEGHKAQDLIGAVICPQGEVRFVSEPEPKLSIEQAEKLMQAGFDEFMNAEEGVFLIEVPTGLGKTRLLENLKGLGVTIAVPTHKLKDELAQRIEQATQNSLTIGNGLSFMPFDFDTVVLSPEAPKFEAEVLTKTIESMRYAGLHKSVLSYIGDIAKGKNLTATEEDKEAALSYVNQFNSYMKANRSSTFITTHRNMMFQKKEVETLIIDEDIMNELLTIKSFKLSDLQKFYNRLSATAKIKKDIENVIAYLSNQVCGALNKTVLIELNMKSLEAELLEMFNSNENLIISGTVLEFLSGAFAFQRDREDGDVFNFIVKSDLPKAKKILIMTATPSIIAYKTLFPDIRVLQVLNVKHRGKIRQTTAFSFSKQTFIKHPERVEQVGRFILDTYALTFINQKDKFQNPMKNVHFGNATGTDEYKGKDIAVVGTFNYPQHVYFLRAMALGIELSMDDNKVEFITVENYKNMSFKFNTFKNPLLQQIQLDMVSAELVQAAGRARGLREDCTTTIFSNCPHPDAEFFDWDTVCLAAADTDEIE